MTATVRIVQLYPDELGVTGDRGNVRTLATRLERSGISAEVIPVGGGSALPPDADVIVAGNGPLSAMRSVVDDLRARADGIRAAVADGVPLFTVGGSAELFSTGVTLLDGGFLEGIGVFPFSVLRTRERRVGYLVVSTPFGQLVGFEDFASEWVLAPGAEAVGVVQHGKGSFATEEGAGEIVRIGAAYATNLQGPVLPLNPVWADVLISAATSRRGIAWSPGDGVERLDHYAAQARSVIEGAVRDHRFSAMSV